MKKALLLSLVFIFAGTGLSYALPLQTVEILSGYFNADLKEKDDYEAVPLLVSFNWDANPLLEKIGLETKGYANLIIEPFANTIFSPDSNAEIGSSFLIKYAFPLTERVMPYFKGGLGMLYMSQHTREQGSQYNFISGAAGGVHVFLKENFAWSFEYRYRHLSNNSFAEPNGGIDSYMYLTGAAFFF